MKGLLFKKLCLGLVLTITRILNGMDNFGPLGMAEMMVDKTKITFSCAALEDAQRIANLYCAMSAQDRDSLFTLPEPYHSRFLYGAIKQKQFWVARTADDTIIGFVRLYIPTSQEKEMYLFQDLHCCGKDVSIDSSYILEILAGAVSFQKRSAIDQDISIIPDTCLFIYYGSAYVHELYRKKGILPALIRYALESIKETIFNILTQRVVAEIIFGFLQVYKNRDYRGMISPFMSFFDDCKEINLVRNTAGNLLGYHQVFRTKKPEYVIDELNKLQRVEFSSRLDFGYAIRLFVDRATPSL